MFYVAEKPACFEGIDKLEAEEDDSVLTVSYALGSSEAWKNYLHDGRNSNTSLHLRIASNLLRACRQEEMELQVAATISSGLHYIFGLHYILGSFTTYL